MALKPAAASRATFVARERELALLASLRREATNRNGQFALVSGAAGVGKSRTLAQFQATLTRGGRTLAAFARCVEFVQTPLGPLRDLLQQLERNGSVPRDARTRALVERLTFEDASAANHTPAGGALFEAIDAALSRYAALGTLVLLVEDLQWADRSTLGFLSYFADRLAKRRILIVATFRSDDLHADLAHLGDFAALLAKQLVTNVALQTLDDTSTRELIEAALPYRDALDRTTISDIVRRSRGNAFFAEELTKAAIERSAAGDSRLLPLSIRGAVLARAASLGDQERRLLSLAAVLGERFSVRRLLNLADLSRDEVLRALERARAAQLIYESPHASDELVFRHALTQEVFYGELLGERVRPIHEAIARELEAHTDLNAQSVQLAHHWLRAGEPARAAHYAEIAGDQALAIGATADAIAFYEQALRATSGDRVADLDHKVGVALGSLGLRTGIERLRRAGDAYWSAGNYEGFAKNASELGAQLYNSGETASAIEFQREAIDALGSKVPRAALDLLRARTAFDCVAALEVESSLAFADEISEPIDDPRTAAFAYQARFKVAAIQGNIARWRVYVRAALDAAARIDDGGIRLQNTQIQIGLDAIGLAELVDAREHFRDALRRTPRPAVTGRAIAVAGSALEHTLRGDFASARHLLDEADESVDMYYATQIHLKSAGLILAICSGDDGQLLSDDAESFLHYGETRGMKLAVGLLGGPYAWALGLRGEVDHAAVAVHRLARILPPPHRCPFAYLAAAQFGNERDVVAMRSVLVTAASAPEDRANKAALALFDALAAARGIGSDDGRSRAGAAATAYETIGWPWLAARAYELAADSAKALEIFREIGAQRDVRRLEAQPSHAPKTQLTKRELEVAALVAQGHSNEEVAQNLQISIKTVERHMTSALQKLNLRSRVQLGRWFSTSE